MRPIISSSLFCQFTAMAFVLACTLIDLMFFANFLTALSSLWYMATCVLQSFPICLTCDQILEDCNKLSLTIFHSNWIGAERRYTSAIKHFIHNAQQPIRFLGCGVLPICLVTYSQVRSSILYSLYFLIKLLLFQMVKMAFSLITFVRQMNIFEGVQ